MLKKLSKYVKQYKTATILTVLFTVGEVALEIFIPYLMGKIIDQGIVANNGAMVVKYGIQMLFLALGGLIFGIASGRFAAYSSSGFAANLRSAIYKKNAGIQFREHRQVFHSRTDHKDNHGCCQCSKFLYDVVSCDDAKPGFPDFCIDYDGGDQSGDESDFCGGCNLSVTDDCAFHIAGLQVVFRCI